MRKTFAVLASLSVLLGPVAAQAGQGLADDDIGLSKTSVFEIPSPEPFQFNEVDTDDAKNLPRAFPGAPPQIPHEITIFLPITADQNECLECHEKPKLIGQEAPGKSPMPRSHYTARWNEQGEIGTKVRGAQFQCTQCHVPQAEVKPLVGNTFSE